MLTLRNRSTPLRVAAAAGVLTFALAGCGGSSSAGSAAGGRTPTATPTGAPGGGFAGGAQFAAIRACLTAAGISLPTRTGVPGASGVRPTAFPSGQRPTAFPSGVRPSGRPGGGFADFANPKVKAALKACGIAVPTGRPDQAAGPTAS